MHDNLKSMDYIFNPRSIAFIGATEAIGKWGFIIMNNIMSGGYDGDIYPVNPGRDKVLGLKTYPSVLDIPGDVDLALFTVPARFIPSALDDCVKKGVKASVVISAGFRELGGDAVDLEKEMVDKAKAAGMVLVGPNGQGICCPRNDLYVWMPNFYPPSGRIAVVSQSGNIQNMMIGGAVRAGFGVSKSVSSGNEAVLKIEDYYSYLAEDPDTDVILSYIESIVDGRRFIEHARRVSADKPIIVLKGGRTRSGVAAASSHTGAMSVSDDLFDAVCRQANIVRIDTIEEAGVVAASFINRPLPRGNRVGIITGGGGLGVIASDMLSGRGLDVVTLSEETLDKIGKHMPAWWVPGNPVDMVAGLNFGSLGPIMEILMQSGEIDSLVAMFIGPPNIEGTRTPKKEGRGIDISKHWDSTMNQLGSHAEELYGLMHDLSVPVFMVANIRREDGLTCMGDNPKIRTNYFTSIDSACRAVSAMTTYAKRVQSKRGEKDVASTASK